MLVERLLWWSDLVGRETRGIENDAWLVAHLEVSQVAEEVCVLPSNLNVDVRLQLVELGANAEGDAAKFRHFALHDEWNSLRRVDVREILIDVDGCEHTE